MSAQVTAQFGAPDPNANPTSVTDLVALFNSLSLAEPVTGGPFTPYVISSTTPAVGDQDKAWFKVDGNGRPLETRLFYNGNWRRVYNGNTSELRMFSGDPTVHFDNTGLGLVGGAWDGWAQCNGNNSTDNWSDQFPIFGRLDNVPIAGYNSGWQSNVTGGATKTGGAATYAIKNTDLPNMQVTVTGRKYDPNGSGQAPPNKYRVIVTDNWSNNTDFTDLNPIASFGSNPSGTPPAPQTVVATLPPYRVCCLCKFVGYS